MPTVFVSSRRSLIGCLRIAKNAHLIERTKPTIANETDDSGAIDESEWHEREYLAINQDVASAVREGTFVSGYHQYAIGGKKEGRRGGFRPKGWDEREYLAINQDVASAVRQGTFVSGYHHYAVAGGKEGRRGGFRPKDWDEATYLQINQDVAGEVASGRFVSGYHHYAIGGDIEGRLGGLEPRGWNEAAYLAINPDARVRIALGMYRNGYLHYAAYGRQHSFLGGLPASGLVDKARLRWPVLNNLVFQVKELLNMTFSAAALSDALRTIARQADPGTFDALGFRVWHGLDERMRKGGGIGTAFRLLAGGKLAPQAWPPWPPRPRYCFINPATGASSFDPFRFMLRRAHAKGTDVRLYVAPLHAVIRYYFIRLELDQQYEFWLRELVRINEEEAALAGRPPFPLWDFSYPNTITEEPIPPINDVSPMRWHWEPIHYRKEAGDLILDRIFDYHSSTRSLPEDVGVSLTSTNIDDHLERSRSKLAAWVKLNPFWTSQIVLDTKKHGEAHCPAPAMTTTSILSGSPR
jgi:hypothetical protein